MYYKFPITTTIDKRDALARRAMGCAKGAVLSLFLADSKKRMSILGSFISPKFSISTMKTNIKNFVC